MQTQTNSKNIPPYDKASAGRPELRFPEFGGEWKEGKIQDILKIGSGKDYKHLKNGDIPVYGTGGYMLSVNKFLFDGKSVLIGRKGTIDKPFYLKGKFWTVDTLFYTYSFGKNIPKYVLYLFQQINWQKYNEASGVPSLSKNTIYKIKIKTPSPKEQHKIASFLSAVDEWIENLKKQKEQLEKYKKGMMQKIFSQKIRFKENNGNNFPEWEEKKLGEMDIHVSDGNYGEKYPKASEMKRFGIPFIRANNIKNLKVVWNYMKYISNDLHNLLVSGHLKSGDILITTRGDIGLLAYVSEEFEGANINAQLCLLRVGKNLSSKYLLNYLSSRYGKKQFRELQTGSALKQLPKGNLAKVKIPCPSPKEQQVIAEFLTSLDNLIESKQDEISKAKNWRKGLMQRMFV
ncbi:restriction endonuclease subunit S [Patescibacteria group bacterium]|nr:restriction endonuclease subunit S [Patescibacteria group bacterium]